MAISLVAFGFAACASPMATHMASERFSAFAYSPYEHDALVRLADATRDFTVGHHDANAAIMDLERIVVSEAYNASAGESPDPQLWGGILETAEATLGSSAYSHGAPEENAEYYHDMMLAISNQNTSLALDADSLSHLVDCNLLLNKAYPLLGACVIVAMACIAILVFSQQRKTLGRMLAWSAALLLAALVLIGLWAYVDFPGFFGAFHAVFFPQGNWTFPSESLLISMYPQAFWVALGAVWLVGTSAAAIICIAIGMRLTRSTGLHRK